jgi:uncharacterized protein
MATVRDCLVMAKPAGPRCNLRCGYCYYLAKESLFPAGPQRMTAELMERYIRGRLEASPGPVTHFEWHGGEPTLMGVDFFAEVVRVQRALRPPGRKITNGLQTNGVLIDEAWADFLSRHGFTVGLSLDGPAGVHDLFRTSADGEGTHARAVQAFRRLSRRGVPCNVLCVLHAGNAGEPDLVYGFFNDLGVRYLQFLPLVWPSGKAGAEKAASADAIGSFLCRVFDLWISNDVGRIVVQSFDEALRPLFGVPHSLCIHRETCGDVAVLEHDGSFYACDHFVDKDHCLGTLGDRSLADLAADPRLLAFGDAKRESLPPACRSECDVLQFCNGGCPKDRTIDGLNALCAGYKAFFRHVQPDLSRLVAHMKAGKALRSFHRA